MTEQRVPEPVSIETTADGAARLCWSDEVREASFRTAVDMVGAAAELALEEHPRVEAWVTVDDEQDLRIATWAGLRREGTRRNAAGDRIVLGRLADDPPLTEGAGFRAMLNSFLPRKRAIGQMLVRDQEGRVMMCRLTYKKDWDLPGGVVEVGESPQVGVSRELAEELGVDLPAGPLVLTDWLPAWSGWDDAVCLVFDGGVQEASFTEAMVLEEREIRDVAFLTLDEIAERATDFTHRRVVSAVASADGTGPAYAESGRPS